VAAALFRPLRGRLQQTIDRHFYRRHYDASRIATNLGTALRDETDLERIQSRLLLAVWETSNRRMPRCGCDHSPAG